MNAGETPSPQAAVPGLAGSSSDQCKSEDNAEKGNHGNDQEIPAKTDDPAKGLNSLISQTIESGLMKCPSSHQAPVAVFGGFERHLLRAPVRDNAPVVPK